jgi:hypothetical protein
MPYVVFNRVQVPAPAVRSLNNTFDYHDCRMVACLAEIEANCELRSGIISGSTYHRPTNYRAATWMGFDVAHLVPFMLEKSGLIDWSNADMMRSLEHLILSFQKFAEIFLCEPMSSQRPALFVQKVG